MNKAVLEGRLESIFGQVNLESPTAHSVDMMIPYCVPSFDDAIALLCKFHGA
jgi:hypothetical protein